MNEQNLKRGNLATAFHAGEGNGRGAVENGRKSGEARRRKKAIQQLAATMLESALTEGHKKALKKLVPDMPEDDATVAAAMVAGQIQAAIKGNTSAYLALSEQAEAVRAKQEAEEKRRLKFHTDLENIPDNFHRLLRDVRMHGHRQYVLHGGRGSMKSSTVAQIIPELLKNNPNVHAMCMRQVGNTLKDSVFSKIKWAIEKNGLQEEFKVTKSPMEITLIATGQKIYFRGADDPAKLKSITPEFGYIGILWFEELDQFGGEEAIRKIEQSVIRGGDDAWIFKTFNPPLSRTNWANQYAGEPDSAKLVHKSAYTDLGAEREWLGEAFIAEAEHLRETNPTAYAHEYAGEAVGTGAEIFPFLEIRKITDEEIALQERIYQGQDWGWHPDPKAFVRLSYNHNTETVMLIDEMGGTCIRTKDMAERIKAAGYDDFEIRCGVDEPEHINDYRDAGLIARPAIVTPGSVRRTHEWLQCRKIVIDPERTPNAYREFSTYEHDIDQKTGEIIDGYPDHDNHYIDAVRYATSVLSMKRGESA